MAGSVNKAIIVGNLGKDPEMRFTGSGAAVCNFTVATNETWKDKAGEKQERTEWHRIVAWGKTAELCGEYLSKGRTVYIEGRIQTRDWQDRDGNKRYTTEVVAQTVQFLGGGGGGGRSAGNGGGGKGSGGDGGGRDDFGPPPPGFNGGSDEDIPF